MARRTLDFLVRIGPWLMILAAPGVASARASDPAVDRPRFYIMRHLDRTLNGDSLSPAGLENACRLARWFARKPLAAVYIRNFARTAATAEPTASERGITVRRFDKTADLIGALRTSRGPVLAVGNSDNLQQIIKGVGGVPPKDVSYFRWIWTVYENGRTTLDRMPDTGPGCPAPPRAGRGGAPR